MNYDMAMINSLQARAQRRESRREFFRTAGGAAVAVAGASALAACGGDDDDNTSVTPTPPPTSTTPAPTPAPGPAARPWLTDRAGEGRAVHELLAAHRRAAPVARGADATVRVQ